MKYCIPFSIRSFFLFSLLGFLSQTSSAQYEIIFNTAYPDRLDVMDSLMSYNYKDSPLSFQKAEAEVDKIIQFVKQRGNREDLLNLKQQRLNNIYTWAMSRNVHYPSFIEEVQQLLIDAHKANYKVIEARTYSLIGQYYFSYENNYRLAFENLIISKEIYQALDVVEYPEKAYSYYLFAYLYYEFSDYESALKITKELEALPKVESEKMVLNNDLMGECYVNLMKFDSARICFENVLKLNEVAKYNTKAWIGIATGKIGETWFYKNDYEKAMPLLLMGLKICSEPETYLSDNITVFAAKLSKIYLLQGNDSLALHYAEISRKAALEYDKSKFVYKKLKAYKFHINYLKAFNEYYRKIGNYKEALKYLDSTLIYNQMIQHQVDVNQKYQAQITIDKEKEKLRLVSEREEKQKQSMIRNTLIALILLLIIILFLIYNWLIQRQRNKDQLFATENILKQQQLEFEQQSKASETEKRKLLEVKNRMIVKALFDKEILLKELHHRVKNNLQIISSLLELQGNRLSDQKSKAAIEEGKGRVMSIALIHQQLYQKEDFAHVEIKPFIRDLVSQVSSSLKPVQLKLKVDYELDASNIHIDKAIPLGLIINELLTNSFKYAFDKKEHGRIDITLKSKPQIFNASSDQITEDSLGSFIYKDDGPGLPQSIDITNTKSLGLKLIVQLSKQINGKLEYRYENGGCFYLEF